MENCSICLEDLDYLDLEINQPKKWKLSKNTLNNITKNKQVTLDCGHIFHLNCIINVKNNRCPLCRKNIVNEPICEGGHFSHFNNNISNFYRNGKCRYCSNKSFKHLILVKMSNV